MCQIFRNSRNFKLRWEVYAYCTNSSLSYKEMLCLHIRNCWFKIQIKFQHFLKDFRKNKRYSLQSNQWIRLHGNVSYGFKEGSRVRRFFGDNLRIYCWIDCANRMRYLCSVLFFTKSETLSMCCYEFTDSWCHICTFLMSFPWHHLSYKSNQIL